MDRPLQWVLIIAVIGLFWFNYRAKTETTFRLIIGGVSVAGIVFILFPDLTTVIARWFGIGRGADLILYLFVVFTLFSLANQSARQRKLEREITELVRNVAYLDHQIHQKERT